MNKKTYIAILIVTITITSCITQKLGSKKYSSLVQEDIKGKVSAVEISRFSIDTASMLVRQDSCCITRTEFDQNGNSIKTGRFTITGVYQGGTQTKYHSNGLIKQISYLNKDKKETARENFFINANGVYIGGDAYDEGKLLRTFKITAQNNYGQWTKFTWYTLDDKIYREEQYTYVENKKIAEVWTEYKDDPKGKIVQDMIFKFNARGEMILQQGIHSHLGQVNQSSNRIFEYDEYGNWVQYIILNSAGIPIRIFKRKLTYR